MAAYFFHIDHLARGGVNLKSANIFTLQLPELSGQIVDGYKKLCLTYC